MILPVVSLKRVAMVSGPSKAGLGIALVRFNHLRIIRTSICQIGAAESGLQQ